MSKQETSVLDNLQGIAESFGGFASELEDGTYIVTKTGPTGGQIHLEADGKTMVGATRAAAKTGDQRPQGPLHSCR